MGELGLRSESRNRSDISSTDAALMKVFDATIDSRHIDRSSDVDLSPFDDFLILRFAKP